MHARNAVLFLLAASIQSPALAQVTYDGCRDFRGTPVASVLAPGIQDVAMATIAQGGQPVIYYNPNVLANLQPPTRLFFYGHECGHHRLGHIQRGMPAGSEQEADCFGVRELVGAGLLSDADVSVVQRDIAAFARTDWSHLPGPIRAINLRACLGQRATTACQHRLHQFDTVPCSHPAHINGDVYACAHICNWPNGQGPCHPPHVSPCIHPAHPGGDAIPCSHVAHPDGDIVE